MSGPSKEAEEFWEELFGAECEPTMTVHKDELLEWFDKFVAKDRERICELIFMGCSTGRLYLNVAGVVTAVQNDTCRDGDITLAVPWQWKGKIPDHYENPRRWDSEELKYAVELIKKKIREPK